MVVERKDCEELMPKPNVTRKECKRLGEEFEVGGWNIAKRRLFDDRGALPKEDRDLLREYHVMHEVGCGRMWRVKRRKGRG